VLIALGTLILSSSGLLNSVVGEMDGFAVTLVLGISVIFAGFLVATGAPRQPPAPAPSAASATGRSSGGTEGPARPAPGGGASRPSPSAAPARR
jgi:hypothetical protein